MVGPGRDMRMELLEYKKQRALRRGDENMPVRNGVVPSRMKVHDEALPMWGQAQSPPRTPLKSRGHVNAISPLMEVCQNTGKSTGEMKRCRPSASPVPSAPLVLSASPPSTPTASSASNQRRCPTSPEMTEEHCSHELRAWEEAAQAPSVPPASPATPYVGLLLSRHEASERRLLQGFLGALPASLRVEAISPSHSPVPRLDIAGSAASHEARWASPVRAVSPSPDNCSATRRTIALEAESPVPAVLESSLQQPSEHDEEQQFSDDESLEADELEQFLDDVRNHEEVWPPRTILDMEDHLSRSHDILTFLFFEVRDRAEHRTANERAERGLHLEPLTSIREYPPGWTAWQIESARSRSAMRMRKRSTSRGRPVSEASVAVC